MSDPHRNALEAMITDLEQRVYENVRDKIHFDDTEDVINQPGFEFDQLDPAQMEEAPVGEAPVEEAPVGEAPVEEAPVGEAPVEEAPVDEAPVDEAPVEEAPVEEAPAPSPAPAPIPVRLEDLFDMEYLETLEIANSNAYVYYSNPINQGSVDVWTRIFYNPLSVGLNPQLVMRSSNNTGSVTQVEDTQVPAPPHLTHKLSTARLDSRTVAPCSKEERAEKINRRKKRLLRNNTNKIRENEMEELRSRIYLLEKEIQEKNMTIRTLRTELHIQNIATGQASMHAGIMQPSQPRNQQPHCPPQSHQHVEPAGEGPPATQNQKAGGDAAGDQNKGGAE